MQHICNIFAFYLQQIGSISFVYLQHIDSICAAYPPVSYTHLTDSIYSRFAGVALHRFDAKPDALLTPNARLSHHLRPCFGLSSGKPDALLTPIAHPPLNLNLNPNLSRTTCKASTQDIRTRRGRHKTRPWRNVLGFSYWLFSPMGHRWKIPGRADAKNRLPDAQLTPRNAKFFPKIRLAQQCTLTVL